MTTPQVAGLESEVLGSALRKARWRLIPLLAVCYLVAYMDRVNISFAAETMNRDLHFTAKMYGLGAGLFFLAYALCEIPSNRLLLRFGARRWIARIMLTWGLLAAGMVLMRTPGSFYGVRMALGMAEAGFFPGALFYLSQWFPKRERARAISLFYVALPLSSVVMGSLAGVLLKQGGKLGMAGWQWLFLVEAAPAVVLSGVIWFALPEGPATVGWLSEEERSALTLELGGTKTRVRESGPGAPGFDGREIDGAGAAAFEGKETVWWAVLRNRYVWGFGVVMFFTLGSSYAVNFSLPLVLRGATGWTPGKVGWLIAGLGLMGAVAMVSGAIHSDRTGERKWHIVLPTLVMAAGLLVAGTRLHGWVGVGALTVSALAYYSMQGPMLSLVSMVLPGDAAAVGIAAMNMCAICGGFVGPYWMGWMHDATGSYAVGIGWLCVPSVLAAGIILWLLPQWNVREGL